MIKVEAPKSWRARILNRLTPEEISALSKGLMILGTCLLTKLVLDMWPSITSTIIKGIVFATMLALLFRTVRKTPILQGYKPWFIPLVIGTVLNFLVVMANGGFMPAVDQYAGQGIYTPMDGASLVWLGDWILGFISPGDIFLFVALAGVIATMVTNRRQKIAEQV